MTIKQNNIKSGHKSLKSILCLLTICVVSQFSLFSIAQTDVFKPSIPDANRNQKNKVFLEQADSMLSGPTNLKGKDSYVVLMGNIKFTRGDMLLLCDSAHYYDITGSIDAYGNVQMQRPSKNLSGRADVVHYDSGNEIVHMVGSVSLSKEQQILTSEAIDYHVIPNTGEYTNRGRLEDNKNILNSNRGIYNFNDDNATFTGNVVLENIRDNYTMSTNKLLYNSRTNVAKLVEATDIVSQDNRITTNSGEYNTKTEVASLYVQNGKQPKLFAKDDRTLVGDKIHYERKKNEGYAQGNVTVVDPKHKAILTGGYGYHNEQTHVSYATDKALARVYNKSNAKKGERTDTLYFHGDTIKTYVEGNDSLRVLRASNGVQFYRKDVQGICGLLVFSERDSILNLYNHPVVWTGERQVSSDNEINVHMKDSSSVDWATLPNKGLLIEHLGEIYYNQLSGDKIIAHFEKNVVTNKDGSQETQTELRHAEVIGNVKTLFFPMENDSTYNKCVRTESKYLTIDLKAKQEVEKIKLWPDVSGTVIPLYLAKGSQLKIQEYQWFDDFRPKKPYDVLNIPSEVLSMFASPYTIQSNENQNKDIEEEIQIITNNGKPKFSGKLKMDNTNSDQSQKALTNE